MNSQESVSEHTAVQIGTDLALDEAGDGHVSRSCSGEEGLELVADDLMEEGLLGLVTFVPVDGGKPIGTGRWQGGRSQSGPCEGVGARGELAGTWPPTRLRVEVRAIGLIVLNTVDDLTRVRPARSRDSSLVQSGCRTADTDVLMRATTEHC
jgi:hypothetical protein